MIASEQEIEELITGFAEEFELNLADGVSLPTTHDIIQTKLVLIGEPAIPSLIRALDSDNVDIREWAVSTLGLLEDPRAVEPLLKILEESEDAYLLEEVIQALGRIGDLRAVEPLIKALARFYKIEVIAEALGFLGDHRAVEPLLEILARYDSFEISYSIVYALGQLGDKKAFEAIATLFKRNLDIYIQQQTELEKLGDKTSIHDLRLHSILYIQIVALGQLKDNRAYTVLTDYIQTNERQLRNSAFLALGTLGDNQAYPLLLSIFERTLSHKANSTWNETLKNIMLALGTLGDPRAFEPLAKVLKTGQRDIALDAALALGELGDLRAFEVLLEELQKGRNPYAAIGLGKLGDKRAVEPLIQAIGDSSNLWRAACAATGLGELGDSRALKPLLQALESESTAVRFRAAEALGKLGQPEALQALEYLALHDFGDNAEIQGGPNRVDEAALTAIRQIRQAIRKAA